MLSWGTKSLIPQLMLIPKICAPELKFVLNHKWLVENSPQEHIFIQGSGREERATLFVEAGQRGGMKRVSGWGKWGRGKLEVLRECLASSSFCLWSDDRLQGGHEKK